MANSEENINKDKNENRNINIEQNSPEILTNPIYKIHFKKRLEKALKNAKAIACRSFVLKDKLLKLYPEFKEKTFVAPSGIDEKIIKSKESFYKNFNSPIKVLTCAHFKKRKNIDKVIKACKGLQRRKKQAVQSSKAVCYESSDQLLCR